MAGASAAHVAVPQIELTSTNDVSIFFNANKPPVAYGDSANGRRSVNDFLTLLREFIVPGDFHLEVMSSGQTVDANGTINPGFYLVAGPAKTYALLPLWTFSANLAMISGVFPDKKRILSEMVKPESGPSHRSTDSEGFKSRLLARDRGCVVCMSANVVDAKYQYYGDSELFNGAHIFPLKYYSLWDRNQFSSIMTDPFTFSGGKKSIKIGDGRRMNSIDNGLLLCLMHHKEFDAHMYSIHPEVEQPWASTCDTNHFPPPHPSLLREHFQASIARWMKAPSEVYEDEDSFEDEENLTEMTEICAPTDKYIVISNSGEDAGSLLDEKGRPVAGLQHDMLT